MDDKMYYDETKLFIDDYTEELKNEYPKLIEEMEQELVSLKKEFKGKRQRYARFIAKKNMIHQLQKRGIKNSIHEEFEKTFKEKSNEFEKSKIDFIEKHKYLNECINSLKELI